jgi:hypothetical protein
MTAAMERVWTRMKTTTSQFADRKTFMAYPPPDALEYLTSELVRLSQGFPRRG